MIEVALRLELAIVAAQAFFNAWLLNDYGRRVTALETRVFAAPVDTVTLRQLVDAAQANAIPRGAERWDVSDVSRFLREQSRCECCLSTNLETRGIGANGAQLCFSCTEQVMRHGTCSHVRDEP